MLTSEKFDDKYSMFYEGRFIMDLPFIDITEHITKVRDGVYVNDEFNTYYYKTIALKGN